NFEAILNLPVSSNRKIINRYGYYSALSEKKMMNPYGKNKFQIYLPRNADSQQVKSEFIELLSSWNVGYVIVHRNFLPRSRNDEPAGKFSWLESFCESTFYSEDNLLVYKIPSSIRIYENEIIIYIPRDFPSIQKGIEAAKDGDILLVAPGRYLENINFKGKAITIKSQAGPEATIIEGNKKGSVVEFSSAESNSSILEGFTICNGSGTVLMADDSKRSSKTNGGGIICIGSSPKIINNIIKNNRAENGGGICCLLGSSPLILNNVIENNRAIKGGGIRCSRQSSPRIVGNRIFGNKALRLGGGIYWRVGSYPVMRNNIIVENFAGEKGGGLFGSSYVKNIIEKEDVVITDCIIRKNISPIGPSIALGGSPSKVIISHCNIEGGRDSISDPEGVVTWADGNIDREYADTIEMEH
ncbi:MAG: hypothetical protein C0412_14930, partial [Flavobacterium sp.]|nr:hypothetical protein [Flavobacterium sp.]